MRKANQVQNFKQYHFFALLSMFNLLGYYLFVGHSLTGNTNTTFLNYFLSVSVLILLIWLSYHIFSKNLISKQMIWVHLFFVMAIAIITPWIILKFYNPFPRRYLDFDNDISLSKLFGNMTWAIVIVSFLFIASEILLLMNIRKKVQ